MAAIVINYTIWFELGSTELEALELLLRRLP